MKKIFVLTMLLLVTTLSIAKEIDIDKSKGIGQEEIVSLTPAPATNTVAKDVIIKAVFNVELDEKHINKHNIKLKRLSGKKKKIKGIVSYLSDEKTIVFTPKKSLKEGYYNISFKDLKTVKDKEHDDNHHTNHHKKRKIKKIKYCFYVPGVVADITAPIISLNGDDNITLIVGETYDELGATAVDDVDGNVSVVISGDVDTSKIGVYIVTYTAKDSVNNSISKTRTINVKTNITNLTLEVEKTNLISRYEDLYRTYVPARSPIKVIATYIDGETAEVTDKVEWNKDSPKIVFGSDFLQAYIGTYQISASLKGVTSNEISIEVEDEIEDEVKILTSSVIAKGRDATVYISLPQKPTADINLTVKVQPEDKIGFFNQGDNLEHTFVITPGNYTPNSTNVLDIKMNDLDINSTKDYTLITESLVSDDPYYNGKNPDDILVKYVTKNPRLRAPRLIERRGAIRGVSIKFRVEAEEKNLKYSLVNPPSGMKIIEDPMFHLPTGVTIQWDVPMDAEEGRIYTITMRAEDGVYHSEINFPIKIPKTRAIRTKIENGELTVIEENSPLFGMKLTGHNGEDISSLELRSVDVGDVWKKYIKKESSNDVLEQVVFIIDNMKNTLDMKFPEYLDNYDKRIEVGSKFFGYTEQVYFGDTLWGSSSRDSYTYNGTKVGLIIPARELEFNSSKVFMFINTKAQKRGN